MKDIRNVYSEVFQKIKPLLSYLPIFAIGVVAAGMVQFFLESLITNNMFGGFIRYFIDIAKMAYFANLLEMLHTRKKLRFSDLVDMDFSWMGPISSVFFIIYLVEYILAMLGWNSSILGGITIILLWEIFTSPALEMVYIARIGGMDAIREIAKFWKINIVAILPFAVVSLFLYLSFSSIIAPFSVLLPFSFLPAIMISVLHAIFLFVKGFLFRELYFSNPRSRAFRKGQNPWAR